MEEWLVTFGNIVRCWAQTSGNSINEFLFLCEEKGSEIFHVNAEDEGFAKHIASMVRSLKDPPE